MDGREFVSQSFHFQVSVTDCLPEPVLAPCCTVWSMFVTHKWMLLTRYVRPGKVAQERRHWMGPRKRAKTASGASTPLQLYKQALRLVKQQPFCNISSDQQVLQKLQQCIDTLTLEASSHQTVDHTLDLCLDDEPMFLLASAHLQLAQVYKKQEQLQLAGQQLQHSLKYFPKYVAAHSALGLLKKYSAASAADLQQAEQHLTTAIDIAGQLSEQEGGLLVDSNKACAAELDAGDAARSALAMLLCQAGRDEAAAPHLTALGYKYRLSTEVLHYPVHQQALAVSETTSGSTAEAAPEAAGSNSSDGSNHFLQVLDSALPAALLQHLQQAFAPSAPFWLEHNYYGRTGYFSYMFSMDEAPSSSMHQLAHHLQGLAVKYLPTAAEAKYAEFWAHCRRHSSGHQLHYDSDDEGQGGIRNPIFTSVLYLESNTSSAASGVECATAASSSDDPSGSSGQAFIGGPTLVTDQVLGGGMATKGWLSYPAVNRFTMFDGRYLHGVVPGRGVSPAIDGRRCTLMMAFWKDLKIRTPPGSGIGACMPMPEITAESAGQWLQMMRPKAGGWGGCDPVPLQTLPSVHRVWQPVTGTGSVRSATYDACFQGF